MNLFRDRVVVQGDGPLPRRVALWLCRRLAAIGLSRSDGSIGVGIPDKEGSVTGDVYVAVELRALLVHRLAFQQNPPPPGGFHE